MRLLGFVLVFSAVSAVPENDKVTSIPGFEAVLKTIAFEIYSGYLSVNLTGSGSEYSALSIHYEFHTCVKSNCPLAVWHQGGPGGSAVFGAWTEMGPLQLMSQGPVTNFEDAWNNVAHMLYLESPAGSTIADIGTGFSSCFKNGVKQSICQWNDVTQATAYAYTLKAFFDAFPEYKFLDLYLVGESYAGQYIPNIATFLVNNPTVLNKNVSGIAVGNGCWGGSENEVRCNGYHDTEMDIDIYHGKGLISKALYSEIQSTCNFSIVTTSDDDDGKFSAFGQACETLLEQAETAVGNYNVYNVYDDCKLDSTLLKNKKELRKSLGSTTNYSSGYPWNCESDPALDAYFTRSDVQEALHLINGSGSGFSYTLSGPASITLYPTLLKHMRILIYNGDADLCVPYLGNEFWVTSMVQDGYAVEASAWKPWYDRDASSYAPAGYVTTYAVPNKLYSNTTGAPDFSFLTIRLAGHMVPQYQPGASLVFFERFLNGSSF